MEIILLQDIDKVGDKHSIVTVKDGYGRNYLIPQKMAIIANDTNRKKLDALRAEEEAKEAARLGEYQTLAAKLDDAVIKVGAKAGTSGKIFGSITNVQLAACLKDQFGVEIERRKIQLPEDVKTLGEYEVVINFHPEVQKTVKFEVVAE